MSFHVDNLIRPGGLFLQQVQQVLTLIMKSPDRGGTSGWSHATEMS